MAYPYGTYNDLVVSVVDELGLKYARTIEDNYDTSFQKDLLRFKPTAHFNDPKIHDLIENFLASNSNQPQVLYIWGHSYEFDRDNSWDLIEGFCKFIGGRDDIWYATNIEIVDYMNAAKNLKYTAKGDRVYNPNAISVWIEVDGQHYEIKPGELKEI